MFTNASIEFKDLELAKETIEAAIAANEKYPFVDATKLYFDLGRILHQLRVEPARELRCYEMSIAAVAPTSSKYVASRRMKAKAHFFAAGPANRMMNFRLRNHHMEECQKLVSDVDLNDPEAKNKFLDETQD